MNIDMLGVLLPNITVNALVLASMYIWPRWDLHSSLICWAA